jgi:hypothetical protein
VELRWSRSLRACVGSVMVTAAVIVPFGVVQLQTTHAATADHFKATGPDRFQGGDDSLFTVADYENYAAAHPDTNGYAFVSACRFAPFTGNSTLYNAFAATEVDAITGESFQTYVDGKQCGQPENEQNISINPTNRANVVTASNDYRDNFKWPIVYVSTNGGTTFTDVRLQGWDAQTGGAGIFQQFTAAGGDPVLAYGPDGTLYYAALEYNFGYTNRTPSGVAVASSRDGGLTWSAPSMVASESASNYFNDKEWITVGPHGAVHVTWTRFDQGAHGAGYIASPIVMSTSHDGGATWSAAVNVSDAAHPYNQGSSPVVAPNGTIYVAYDGATPTSQYNADAAMVATSTDGGQTFTNTEVTRIYDDYNCYPLNVSQGRPRLSFEQFRLNSFPTLAVDPSTGALAMAWADDRANASCGWEKGGSYTGITQNQVQLVTSSDGSNWTAVRTITGGDSFDKAFPSVAANHGKVVVGYYTRAYSPTPTRRNESCASIIQNTTTGALVYGTAPICLDYATRSSASSFATETRVTSQSSNPYIQFTGSFIGDYTGVAVDNTGVAHAVWTDFRGHPAGTPLSSDVTAPNQDTVVGNGL